MRELPNAVILSGGLGTRLRGVIGSDTPKPMAEVGGRPFIELLLKQLKRHGFSRVILSVGYRHEVIREHFGERAFEMELVYSVETSPLGTGGALRKAADYIGSEVALVMNGDSYTDVDLNRLVQKHSRSGADLTVVAIRGARSDAGLVVLDKGGRVVAFAEKRASSASRYLSAGIYVANKNVIASVSPGERISLEERLFPEWLSKGKHIRGFISDGPCLDIGTPERFQMAQTALEKAESGCTLESEGRS